MLVSFVSICSFARLWDNTSHQAGWLDRCNLLSCLGAGTGLLTRCTLGMLLMLFLPCHWCHTCGQPFQHMLFSL